MPVSKISQIATPQRKTSVSKPTFPSQARDNLTNTFYPGGCPPDSAFASNATFDFIAAVWNEQLTDFWSIDEATEANKRRLTFDDDGNGMTMVLSDEDQTPKSSSRNYLFFGKISVEAQAAAGKGVVTAISLKSDLGDEIEWVSRVQAVFSTKQRVARG